MAADHEGFLRPQIEVEKCIQCHACERVCPVLHVGEADLQPKCYAARTRDEEVRSASSSGGVFTELARATLAKGGVVFGCVWEKPDLVAIHAKAETEQELAEMRGSKYVQSDLRNTFCEAKAELAKGREVLFSGTSCQIAGLKRFLGKPYSNLMTIEVICHGVPSPAILKKYKQTLEHSFRKKVVELSCRSKRESWRRFSLLATFSDGSDFCENRRKNPYLLSFLSDCCLRPSCYQCQARAGRSGADISIADFWGIETVYPDMDDNRGISVVLIHSEKGRAEWETLADVLEVREVAFDMVVARNAAYLHSAKRPKERTYFMKRVQKTRNLGRLAKKCKRMARFRRDIKDFFTSVKKTFGR
jgi:coenzyme F420-reducing hydrogenase beta subunit